MILPKWYYYRGGVSDRKFIEIRMAHIPAELQKEVSEKYEDLYLQDGHVNVKAGRKAANEYLHKTARIYQSKCVQQGQLVEPKKVEIKKHNVAGKQGGMPSKYNGKILRDAGL